MKKDKSFRPDRVLSYFRVEWFPLLLVTLSGLVYNIGLLAAPWFEGRLAQCLADILGGNKIVLVGSVIQEQITKGRNQPFAAALSAVLMILTSVMIRLYRKITGTSQLEGIM